MDFHEFRKIQGCHWEIGKRQELRAVHDVLVIGDINPDLMMIDYNRIPSPGEETHASAAELALGGGAAICASGLSNLGMKVAIYGYVGNDTLGQLMTAELEKAGIETGFVTTTSHVGTGISVAFTNKAERAFMTFDGANGLLDVENVPDEVLCSARHIHVLCYAPDKHTKYLSFFRRVRSLNRTVSFDLGYDDTEEWSAKVLDLAKIVDIFMPNDKEAMRYTRTGTPDAALRILSEIGNTVVIKRGKDGSIGSRNSVVERAEAFKVTSVDTTGAGDSFNSGFIYGWLNGNSLKECLLIGNAMGASSVQKYGGCAGVPDRAHLRKLLEAEGIMPLRGAR